MSDTRPFGLPDGQQAGNLILVAIHGWALSVEVFLRRDFGSRYIGAYGALVPIIILLQAMMWERQDLTPLFLFCGLFLLFCGAARLDALWRARRGEMNHTYYSGSPILKKFLPCCSEATVKKFVEPLFVFGVGMLLGDWNPPLGVYMCFASACLLVRVHHAEMCLRRRAAEMNDAVLEQEDVAQRFRDLRGDYF